MAYAMTYARHEDMRLIRQYVSDEDFREALDRAPPGIIDPRSSAYWNSKMGRYPAPPLPRRHFGDDKRGSDLSDPKCAGRMLRSLMVPIEIERVFRQVFDLDPADHGLDRYPIHREGFEEK